MHTPLAARWFWATTLATVALVVVSSAARADLFGLTFSDAFGPTVARFSDEGRYLGTVPASYGEGLGGLDAAADGRLYFVSNTLGTGSLIAMDPPYTQASTSFISAQGLEIPIGLTVDAAGRAYVASNQFSSRGLTGVFRYDPVSRATTFIPARAANGSLGNVAVAPNGDVFVGRLYGVLPQPPEVERYDRQTGAFLGAFVPDATRSSYSDLEFGPDGNLYVATNAGINRYRPTGEFVDTFIPAAAGASDFAFGGDGLVYVNSPATHTVLRYDSATGLLHDVFIPPEGYGAAGVLSSITVVVPEPAPAALLLAWLLPALRRHRR